MEIYTELILCGCCKGKGKLLNYEKFEFTCPYCDGNGKRKVKIPHPSHKMSGWKEEILAPAGTPRFYAVRKCELCEEEEWKHSAGHFLHRLSYPCEGERK